MKVFLLRGLPGCGKDHYIRNYCLKNSIAPKVFSTDSYFMKDGVYVFDQSKLGLFHNYCLNDFTNQMMKSSDEVVFVSNTNIRVFEIAPYYRIAEAFGHQVEIIHIVANPDDCKKRNLHNVPPETIDKMLLSMEPLPPFWKVQVVFS